jgi:hypothetical protein
MSFNGDDTITGRNLNMIISGELVIIQNNLNKYSKSSRQCNSERDLNALSVRPTWQEGSPFLPPEYDPEKER